jgi:hypothetical protein
LYRVVLARDLVALRNTVSAFKQVYFVEITVNAAIAKISMAL